MPRGRAAEREATASDRPPRTRPRPRAATEEASATEVALGDPPPHLTAGGPVAPTSASLEARAEALRERYGPYGLDVRVEAPFVLVGDEGPVMLRRYGEQIVRWAVRRLQADFFDTPPRDIVEVWLLGNDDSYRTYARSVFGDDPDTPYGYFSQEHQVLVMNISTGGGTLVHELVHPFIDSDFPACPSWFDEGLASLYEQSADNEGRIWGLTNWRLAGLQRTIESKTLPSFPALLATTRHEFYEEDPGSNYGQARYLCLYLQEQGKLRSFYRDFRRDVGKDPGGLKTLRAHVGDDLAGFQRRWEQWVLTLRYG